jgi:hypothetical protein
MQYQYSDDHGRLYQSGRKPQITMNWRKAGEVKEGNWLVAYLGKNTFHAIGRVRTPRRARTENDPTDTVDEYLKHRQSHKYDSGYVYYTDVFYEDFSDRWRTVDSDGLGQRYPQRIDVDEWRYCVPGGVFVEHALKNENVSPDEKIKAIFPIKEDVFFKIRDSLSAEAAFPDEMESSAIHTEGALKKVVVNAYERDRDARLKCIAHYGWACAVCGYNMAEMYGELGDRVIHVHHLRQLSTVKGPYQVDPIADLRPVCPNCHTILHIRSPVMTIEELRETLSRRKRLSWPRTDAAGAARTSS